MDEATRSAWCREHGLYLAELDVWKQDAIAGLGEPRSAPSAAGEGPDLAPAVRIIDDRALSRFGLAPWCPSSTAFRPLAEIASR